MQLKERIIREQQGVRTDTKVRREIGGTEGRRSYNKWQRKCDGLSRFSRVEEAISTKSVGGRGASVMPRNQDNMQMK